MTYPIVVTSSNCSLLCATKRIILNHCPVDSNGKAAGGTSTGWVMFTKLGMLCVWQIWPSTQNSNLRISPNDNSLRKILPKWPRHTYTSSLILTSYVSIILGFLSRSDHPYFWNFSNSIPQRPLPQRLEPGFLIKEHRSNGQLRWDQVRWVIVPCDLAGGNARGSCRL